MLGWGVPADEGRSILPLVEIFEHVQKIHIFHEKFEITRKWTYKKLDILFIWKWPPYIEKIRFILYIKKGHCNTYLSILKTSKLLFVEYHLLFTVYKSGLTCLSKICIRLLSFTLASIEDCSRISLILILKGCKNRKSLQNKIVANCRTVATYGMFMLTSGQALRVYYYVAC